MPLLKKLPQKEMLAKVSKKIIIGLLILLLVLLSIPTTVWFLFQHSKVQTWLVAKATEIIETKIGTKVIIQKVDYRPFNKILLKNVFIADLRHDTLLVAETISVSLLRFSNEKKILNLHRVTIEDAIVSFRTDSLGVINVTELIDALDSDTTQSSGESFIIKIRNARFVASTFCMSEYRPAILEHGVNFEDLRLNNLNLDIKNFEIGDTISFTIADMNFSEKSGLEVEQLRSDVSLSSNHFNFERLRLLSMGSRISMPNLYLSYSSWSDLGGFIEKVNMQGTLERSRVTTTFLSFFASDLSVVNETFNVSCTFRGTINDIRIRNLELNTRKRTNLKANLNLIGLPDIDSTYLFVDVKSFRTELNDIAGIIHAKTGKPLIELPKDLDPLQFIQYKGNFTGFISDFVAFGSVSTAIGSISLDLSIKPNQNKSTSFNGTFSTPGIDVGKLIDDEMFGKISMKATLKGSTNYSDFLDAVTDATIHSLRFNDYNYTNIQITGNLTSKTYIGNVFLDDPNVRLNFMGKVDFSDSIPVFDFSAFVPKFDLVKLNLNKADSISQASFLLTAKFSGSNIDNSRGEIKVVNCFYRNQNGEIKTSDIILFANNTIDNKIISLKSEFLEAELRGKYNYANLFSSLNQLVYRYIPALSPDKKRPELTPTGVENPEYNDYIIKLRLRKTQKLTDVLTPGFRIAENTNVFCIYNPDFQSLTLKVMVPEILLGDNKIRNITIDGQTHDTTFTASVSVPLVEIGQTQVKNITINTTASNNDIETSIGWDNRTTIKNQGKINVLTHFDIVSYREDPRINLSLLSSQFYLNDTIWNILPSSVVIDSNLIVINDFSLQNNLQKLTVNGKISNNPFDSVIVELENLDVSNFNLYTEDMGYKIAGKLGGQAKVTDILGLPLFFSDLTLDEFQINDKLVGDIQFSSKWFPQDKKLAISTTNTFDNSITFRAKGDLFPETSKINFQVDIDRILLTHFEPMLEGEVTNLNGYLTGNLKITGTTDKPIINGMVRTNGLGLTIDFSKTHYNMSDPIYIENSNIVFRGFRIYDVNNRIASLSGVVRTNFFHDISLDLGLSPSNFQFLNTTERDNESFYGTVFASGVARITGTPSDLNVNASLKTEPRTAIFLPISSTSEVAEHDFIAFVNRSNELIIIEDLIGIEETTKSNLSLTIDLEVTPEAEAQIIIDKQLGDIIRANGSGNLKMEINPYKDIFNMYGQYEIEKGDYLFTLQGVINKRFRIGDGSTILWNGDIEDATMNIRAIYTLRTPLSPLFPDQQDDKFKRRTPVDCQIQLAGKLMEPSIEFNIEVPSADSETKALLQGTLNTEERISMQFLSLLVINSFIPIGETQTASSGGSDFSQGLATTASEMLSNQLSNWLSQWSNTFDIGLNYRPDDPNSELSSNELELAISTQLFNDRVSINGNVDMGTHTQSTSSPIAGDFSIDVKIVPSGKIRLKAFARSNDDMLYSNTNSPYTTGAGVMYREDFNSINELWSRYKRLFKPASRRNNDADNQYPDYDSSLILPDSLQRDESHFLGLIPPS